MLHLTDRRNRTPGRQSFEKADGGTPVGFLIAAEDVAAPLCGIDIIVLRKHLRSPEFRTLVGADVRS
jgi:hypothetical protein